MGVWSKITGGDVVVVRSVVGVDGVGGMDEEADDDDEEEDEEGERFGAMKISVVIEL